MLTTVRVDRTRRVGLTKTGHDLPIPSPHTKFQHVVIVIFRAMVHAITVLDGYNNAVFLRAAQNIWYTIESV